MEAAHTPTHRGKRSKQGQQHQKERSILSVQQELAKQYINDTNFHDRIINETVATVETEDVYTHLKDVCLQEPDPKCAPQQLDGTVIDSPNFHFELFEDCNEALK